MHSFHPSQYLASAAAIQSNAPQGNTTDIPADELAAKRQKRVVKLGQALEGLRNVIKANHGVESICNGNYKLLFSLLQFENPKVQGLTLEVGGSSQLQLCIVWCTLYFKRR